EVGIRLVRERCRHDIGPAVVIHIGSVGSHARKYFSFIRVADTGRHAILSKRAVAVVHEQKLLKRIVRNADIHPAVIVEIGEGNPESLAWRSGNMAASAYIRERTVAVVVEQIVRDRLEVVRMAIGPAAFGAGAAELIF